MSILNFFTIITYIVIIPLPLLGKQIWIILKKIRFVSQLNEGDIIDIFYYGTCIKQNCLIVELIQDHYFTQGLMVYLNGTSRETIDLENNEGLWVKKASI